MTTAVNLRVIPALLEGNAHQLPVNTVCALAIMVYAFVATYLIAFLVDRLIGLSMEEEGVTSA